MSRDPLKITQDQSPAQERFLGDVKDKFRSGVTVGIPTIEFDRRTLTLQSGSGTTYEKLEKSKDLDGQFILAHMAHSTGTVVRAFDHDLKRKPVGFFVVMLAGMTNLKALGISTAFIYPNDPGSWTSKSFSVGMRKASAIEVNDIRFLMLVF